MDSHSVAPMSLIILCVICIPYWNSLALTHFIGLTVVANGGLICTIVFLYLLISDGVILHSLKNLSHKGRHKALQTCGSHLTVGVCFFVPYVFIYVRPAKTFLIDKSLSVFFTVITPMLNPLIYIV